jgi:2-aminoadipate transaminase
LFLRHELSHRAAALREGVLAGLGDNAHRVDVSAPKGGYFLWLSFPPPLTASTVLSSCSGKVAFHPGERFSIEGRWESSLRLSFAHYPPHELRTAGRIVGEAISKGISAYRI